MESARSRRGAPLTYEVDIGGRVRQVTVERAGDGFAVTLDGRTRHVDAVRINAHTLSLVVDNVRPNDTAASYEVMVTAGAELSVRVGGSEFAVTVNGRGRGRRNERRDPAQAGGGGPQRIVAPMPGKIVRVLVQSGETVQARQPVVVIEAMKMENELRAAGGGTVAEIRASEGTSVDAGALLVVIQ